MDMKKWIMTLLPLFLLTGCMTNGRFETQTKLIQLRGNPTTGYTWQVEISDESIVSVGEEIQYLGEDGMTGAPSLFNYTLYSEKPGITDVIFEYRRPWESKPADNIRHYEVTVKENGKIVIREMENGVQNRKK